MVKIKKQGKFLKKPTASTISGISSSKTLRSFAAEDRQLVREAEREEVVQDNRSQFFRREQEMEERGIKKWLG